jgi:hypothetical protein
MLLEPEQDVELSQHCSAPRCTVLCKQTQNMQFQNHLCMCCCERCSVESGGGHKSGDAANDCESYCTSCLHIASVC